NGYAAKFATPYLLATGFVRGSVGLGAFTQEAIRDSSVLALAAKVKYVIDPENPYPNNYTGHVRAAMNDGSVVEERQPYLRGGAIAAALADGGASIVVNARSNRAEADAVAREIEAAGVRALAHIADVADAGAVQAMADMAVKHFGRIDILVNNAALRREKPFA